MALIGKKEIVRLHTLLNNSGLLDAKRELIAFYSRGRTNSAKELTVDEFENLIEHLIQHDSGDRMRKKIFSIAYDLKIIYPHADKESDKHMNRAALDKFLKANSYLHKSLNEYTVNELPKLVSQMMQILKHNNESEANKAVKTLLNGLNARIL
jgi:hypothetical protein